MISAGFGDLINYLHIKLEQIKVKIIAFLFYNPDINPIFLVHFIINVGTFVPSACNMNKVRKKMKKYFRNFLSSKFWNLQNNENDNSVKI